MAYWTEQRKEKRTEKRKKPDALVLWIKASSLIIWGLIITALSIFNTAKPEVNIPVLDSKFNKQLRTSWDTGLIDIAFYMAIFIFFFSIVSLMINTRRLKRKGDHLSISLILGLVLSLIAIIAYLVTSL